MTPSQPQSASARRGRRSLADASLRLAQIPLRVSSLAAPCLRRKLGVQTRCDPMKGSTKGRGAGFTLIEMAIGIALAALTAVSLAGVLRSGAGLWIRLEARSDFRQEARVALEHIAADVRRSIDVPGVGWFTFEGTTSFAVFQCLSRTPARSHSEEAIMKVMYRLEPSGHGLVLKRSQQRLSPQGTEEAVETSLTRRATTLEWEYAFASSQALLEWRPEWKSTPAGPMPSAVRVRLTLRDDAGGTETFIRTVSVPSRSKLPWVF